ncbi:MAG: hypothetical protein CMK32_09215 [Porticoccaceae bacterium]|nr:hypothetical protein [Porticoccaceae bacterium]
MRDRVERLHRGLLIALLIVMSIELVAVLYKQQWHHAFLLLCISMLSLFPVILHRQYSITITAEFQILTVVFVFAALFLGEIHSYYDRLWWWDIALHASSGLLLGLLGFLLVYVLNENERIGLSLQPRFVALFAFTFAVAIGTLWEIFEFSMDRNLGLTMQKPMFGDDSGLTDTMWDLIVDVIGALIISLLGLWYMVRKKRSFIDLWIQKFIARNPRLFRNRH